MGSDPINFRRRFRFRLRCSRPARPPGARFVRRGFTLRAVLTAYLCTHRLGGDALRVLLKLRVDGILRIGISGWCDIQELQRIVHDFTLDVHGEGGRRLCLSDEVRRIDDDVNK